MLVSSRKYLSTTVASFCYYKCGGVIHTHHFNAIDVIRCSLVTVYMCLQVLEYKKYSTLSDVWSFGCVLYEIWTLGHKPFEDIPVKDVRNC